MMPHDTLFAVNDATAISRKQAAGWVRVQIAERVDAITPRHRCYPFRRQT
jgi:hypothetical protein